MVVVCVDVDIPTYFFRALVYISLPIPTSSASLYICLTIECRTRTTYDPCYYKQKSHASIFVYT